MAFENGISGYVISIHALVKRATTTGDIVINDKQDFNPRPREEGDGYQKISR